jgi:hypothetical protein
MAVTTPSPFQQYYTKNYVVTNDKPGIVNLCKQPTYLYTYLRQMYNTNNKL